MFIKPKPGLLIRDPDTRQALPPGGREVPESSWWMRCLASGDVESVAKLAPEATPKLEPAKGQRRPPADEVKS